MIWKISINEVRILVLGCSSIICGLFSILKLNYEIIDVIEWEFFSLNSFSIVFTLIFDWISLRFLWFVFIISSRVLYYRGRYIKEDKRINRFIYLVLAFVLSIIIIVLSPNIIRILLGWDGLGLVSYALVIYYQNEKSANAGLLTILSNRVGDVAILLSIGLLRRLGRWNFVMWGRFLDDRWLILKFLTILAAITKRAQIPFSAWLPAAMAAPTPVSALVHSSTLVTAGVYLIIRFRYALEGSKCQRMLLVVSCLTIFIAGLGANFEFDLKKIIALSTLRQLGVILRILSLGYPELAFFHLLSHALFKALLFICAGAIIHRVRDNQDIRCIGGLIFSIPLSISFISVANLALCGFPFLAGFYSKDLILEVAFLRWINFIAFILYVLATGLTVIYTARLIFYSLRGEFNLRSLNNVDDSDFIITNSMIILGLGGITGGAILSWLIFPEPYFICIRDFIKNLVLIVRILGGLLGYIFNLLNTSYNLKSLSNYRYVVIAGSIWFLPFLSSFKNRQFSLFKGRSLQKVGDSGWYEYIGGQGIFYFTNKMFTLIYYLQINTLKVFIKISIIRFLFIIIIYT